MTKGVPKARGKNMKWNNYFNLQLKFQNLNKDLDN